MDDSLTYQANSSQTDSAAFDIKAVPEPSTWALLGVGAVGLGVVALRLRAALV